MRREDLEQVITITLGDIIMKTYITPEHVEITGMDGIDSADYPDFVDAYITSAWCKPLGRELSDAELEYFNDNFSDAVYNEALERMF